MGSRSAYMVLLIVCRAGLSGVNLFMRPSYSASVPSGAFKS